MHNPSILGNSIEVLLEIILPDEIDNDVDPIAACGGQNFLGPVLGVVIESRRCAESLRAKLYLFRGSGCDVDGRGALRDRELNTSD